MKRLILIMYLALSVFFNVYAQNSYTLSGKIAEGNLIDTIFLKKIVDRETGELIKKVPVRGNRFEIKGTQDSTIVAFLEYRIGKGDPVKKSFLLQNGTIYFDLGKSAFVSGTALNDSLQVIVEHREGLSENWEKADESYEKASPDKKEALKGDVAFWRNATQNYTVDAINRNIDNPLGLLLLFEYTKFTPVIQLANLIANVPEKYKEHPFVIQQRDFLNGIEKTGKGQHYIDFELPDPNGKLIKFSDIVAKNKYTVIDFWASWCVPCCHEMPELIKLYEKYKNRGLGVIGISWDRDKNSWIAAIKRLNIPWLQLSDVKGRENSVGKLYGVRTIPSVWIIDQNGIIVAKLLRGDDVPDIINGLFN